MVHRKHSGQYLCPECFIASVEKIIYKTISKMNMLHPRDKIVVGLSGGKDSIVLLYNLIKIQKETFNGRLPIALTIDEGIQNYRKTSIKHAKQFCDKFKIDHKIISFRQVIGKNLDEILEIQKQNKDYRYACNYCALIRRRLLNQYAKKLGGSVLAMGHNLTDIAETYLMNILFKRFHLISNQYLFREKSSKFKEYYIQKIMPLMKIPEQEIFLYVNLKNLPYHDSLCPYRKTEPIIRKKVWKFIIDLKENSPEIEFNLFNGFMELSKMLNKYYERENYHPCKICGYPTKDTREKCSYCTLLEQLNLL